MKIYNILHSGVILERNILWRGEMTRHKCIHMNVNSKIIDTESEKELLNVKKTCWKLKRTQLDNVLLLVLNKTASEKLP